MRLQEIFEAKGLIDLRHPVQQIPGSTRPEVMVEPDNGFYFEMSHDGQTLVLHSAENSFASGAVIHGGYDNFRKLKIKLPWNTPSGLVDFSSKTIPISKEQYSKGLTSLYRARNISDLKSFQKLLKALRPYGVSDDFRVKGASNLSGTVGEIISQPDPTDAILAKQQTVMYHGTSMKRWKEIEQSGRGLVPGNTRDEYSDLKKGYSEKNVYLATSEKAALYYAKRQAKKEDDTQYVILQVRVPDMSLLVSDDMWASNFTTARKEGGDFSVVSRHSHYQGSDHRSMSLSGRQLGEYGYRGRIPMTCLRLFKTGKVPSRSK